MRFFPGADVRDRTKYLAVLLLTALMHVWPLLAGGAPGEAAEAVAGRLLNTGVTLAGKTHYLEALDVLQEARDLLESSGAGNPNLHADVLFALAQIKIKGRLHQGFPAVYVKAALEDVAAANKLREKIPGIPPQKLAEGYYLEGFIHKTFFKRKSRALACFEKAVNIDPGFAAAKREKSELVAEEEKK